MPPKNPEITVAEAAELLGISKRRVHAILNETSGRLKVSRILTVGAVTVHMLKRADVERYRPFVQGHAGRPRKDRKPGPQRNGK